jgi:hypothetical protein
MTQSQMTFLRYLLGSLLAFMALNALGGGFYGLSGAEGVPVAWLEGSPFRNYFIPGLILFAVVGGSFFFASIAVFGRFRFARKVTFAAVAIVFIWLAVQVSIIGYVSWMQPTTAALGLVVLVLTLMLPRQESDPAETGKG